MPATRPLDQMVDQYRTNAVIAECFGDDQITDLGGTRPQGKLRKCDWFIWRVGEFRNNAESPLACVEPLRTLKQFTHPVMCPVRPAVSVERLRVGWCDLPNLVDWL